MTWYGNPYVYKKDEIIVITPRITAHVLDAMGFDELFEFLGPISSVRIHNKKVIKYQDIFSDTRMARLMRISMDLDKPYCEYLEIYQKDKKERASKLRKSKITAVKGLLVKPEDKVNLSCSIKRCGRRFLWYPNRTKEGQCPGYDSKIKIAEMKDGRLLIKSIEEEKNRYKY